jgi:hypothetical protein
MKCPDQSPGGRIPQWEEGRTRLRLRLTLRFGKELGRVVVPFRASARRRGLLRYATILIPFRLRNDMQRIRQWETCKSSISEGGAGVGRVPKDPSPVVDSLRAIRDAARRVLAR